MALEFNGSSDGLQATSAPATIEPLTMACWYKENGGASAFTPLMCLRDSAGGAGNDRQIRLVISDEGSGWRVEANSWSTDGYHYGEATTNSTTGTWQHACGVWASTSSRVAYLNGANAGSDTNLNDSTATPNQLNIGYAPWSGGTDYANAYLAEIAVWNAALTASEIASLAKGFSPAFIRPSKLVFYLPGIRVKQDLRRKVTLTETGTVSIIVHPRIIYPR